MKFPTMSFSVQHSYDTELVEGIWFLKKKQSYNLFKLYNLFYLLLNFSN